MNELGNNSIEWVWRENRGNVCESQKTKLGQIGGRGGVEGGVSLLISKRTLEKVSCHGCKIAFPERTH